MSSSASTDIVRLHRDFSSLSACDSVSVASEDDILSRIRARTTSSSRRRTGRRAAAAGRSSAGSRSIDCLASVKLKENDGTSTDSDFYDTDLEAEEQPADAAGNL